MIEIDGSYGEGGGQIIRTAIGLSTHTGVPCRISNIRKNRPKPGLRSQHLKVIESCSELSGGEYSEADVGTTEIEYIPGSIRKQKLSTDIGTAGSVTLLLQSLLIPLSGSRKEMSIHLKGGTHTRWSPSINYFDRVLNYHLNQMGLMVTTQIEKIGFYPKGGGSIRVHVRNDKKLKPIQLTSRKGKSIIRAESIASENLKNATVAERQILGAVEHLQLDERETSYVETYSAGTAILITAEFENCILSSEKFGKQGKPAEKVGSEAAENLDRLLGSGATADKYLSDQLLPFLALTDGVSTFIAPELTNHFQTNKWVIQQFLDVSIQTEKVDAGFKVIVGPAG